VYEKDLDKCIAKSFAKIDKISNNSLTDIAEEVERAIDDLDEKRFSYWNNIMMLKLKREENKIKE